MGGSAQISFGHKEQDHEPEQKGVECVERILRVYRDAQAKKNY